MTMTFDIGLDCLDLQTQTGDIDEIREHARRAWRRYGRQTFVDTTLAAGRLLVERSSLPPDVAAPLLAFLNDAMAAHDALQEARRV